MDFDNEEDELGEEAILPKADDALFMGVDDEDLLGGESDSELSEEEELDAFGLTIKEDEEPEF